MVEVSEEDFLSLTQDLITKSKATQGLGRSSYPPNNINAIDRHHKDDQQARRMGQ